MLMHYFNFELQSFYLKHLKKHKITSHILVNALKLGTLILIYLNLWEDHNGLLRGCI